MKIDLKRLGWTIMLVAILLVLIYGVSCLLKVDYTFVLSVFGFLYIAYDIYDEIE